LSNSWNQIPTGGGTPTPELNPLQNPILGENLDRWAQVYFNNPPEKRDEAVKHLLRELQNEVDDEVDLPGHLQVSTIQCRSCFALNAPDQKYCGACGRMLVPVMRPDPALFEPTEPAAEPVPERIPLTNDVEWLRDRALQHLDESDDSQPSRGLWKYVMVSLLLILGGFGALEYVSRRPVPVVVETAPSSLSPASTTPASTTPVETAKATETPKPPVDQPSQSAHPSSAAAGNVDSSSTPAAETAKPTASKQSEYKDDTVPADANAGEPQNGELARAEALLEGKAGPRDPANAARLLWTAVGKQNTGALVLLADLYERGDGVAKNCDQARLLLVAASRKGDSYAAQRLRNLQSTGCQ